MYNIELLDCSQVLVERTGIINFERAEKDTDTLNLSFVRVGSLSIDILLLKADDVIFSVDLMILCVQAGTRRSLYVDIASCSRNVINTIILQSNRESNRFVGIFLII